MSASASLAYALAAPAVIGAGAMLAEAARKVGAASSAIGLARTKLEVVSVDDVTLSKQIQDDFSPPTGNLSGYTRNYTAVGAFVLRAYAADSLGLSFAESLRIVASLIEGEKRDFYGGKIFQAFREERFKELGQLRKCRFVSVLVTTFSDWFQSCTRPRTSENIWQMHKVCVASSFCARG
jgi:hypothetical protein